jgi:hypothetical protein
MEPKIHFIFHGRDGFRAVRLTRIRLEGCWKGADLRAARESGVIYTTATSSVSSILP